MSKPVNPENATSIEYLIAFTLSSFKKSLAVSICGLEAGVRAGGVEVFANTTLTTSPSSTAAVRACRRIERSLQEQNQIFERLWGVERDEAMVTVLVAGKGVSYCTGYSQIVTRRHVGGDGGAVSSGG